MGLELASTEDLIKELYRRTTFVGVIVHSHSEHRISGQSHNQFSVYDATGGNMVTLLNHVINSYEKDNVERFDQDG